MRITVKLPAELVDMIAAAEGWAEATPEAVAAFVDGVIAERVDRMIEVESDARIVEARRVELAGASVRRNKIRSKLEVSADDGPRIKQ